MGAFDVSFLNKNFQSKSSDYGFLVDHLDIQQQQLESDGKLSPGDYNLLIEQAQKAYSNPGLTPAQRSNINVKIATYKSEKSKTSLSDNENLTKLNNSSQDDMAQIGMRFSNDPEKYLEAKSTAIAAKVDQLSSSIDSLDSAGDDSSSHTNELTQALKDYSDTVQALNDVKGYNNSGTPTSNFAAYLTTNSKGEIVDMKIDRIGAQSGYNETNGLYKGLPVYGKLNRKDASGSKIFQLGNQTFSAPDLVTPSADGTMKPTVLISSDQQKSAKGGFSIATSGYKDVDLSQVHPQGAIPDGSWVQGDKGFLYQKQSDGSYIKYVNGDKTKLGISDNNILRVPKTFEQGIVKNVSQTVDASKAPSPLPPVSDPSAIPGGSNVSTTSPSLPGGPGATAPTAPAAAPQQRGIFDSVLSKMTGGRDPQVQASAPKDKTTAPPNQPTVRSPQTAGGIAQQASSAVGGFLGRLFGGGK